MTRSKLSLDELRIKLQQFDNIPVNIIKNNERGIYNYKLFKQQYVKPMIINIKITKTLLI
jgi:hypothetical protein